MLTRTMGNIQGSRLYIQNASTRALTTAQYIMARVIPVVASSIARLRVAYYNHVNNVNSLQGDDSLRLEILRSSQ
jgi:hypothetical protein